MRVSDDMSYSCRTGHSTTGICLGQDTHCDNFAEKLGNASGFDSSLRTIYQVG